MPKWFPFLYGFEFFFGVSDKEVEWIEVLVFVCSIEILVDENGLILSIPSK